MGEEEAVIAVVTVLCGTGLMAYAISSVRAVFTRRSLDQEASQELKALRQEIAALRQQNNDVILNLDATVGQLDRRMAHLETRAQLPSSGTPAAEEQNLVSRSG